MPEPLKLRSVHFDNNSSPRYENISPFHKIPMLTLRNHILAWLQFICTSTSKNHKAKITPGNQIFEDPFTHQPTAYQKTEPVLQFRFANVALPFYQ